MLEAGSAAIVGHLFGDCDLLGWLLNAPAQYQPEQRPEDDRCRDFLFESFVINAAGGLSNVIVHSSFSIGSQTRLAIMVLCAAFLSGCVDILAG
jgi:hypothetical protein